ncbi:hypothetical protein [Polymorphospora rubra]|uniref:Uncharacterized protein n=1 Tax=Polymorphospora rubra TaxID=338584 RepID=A0A810NBX3_9ACTN|nr:hypothetical protein [Polymorphospora rubra]BCJ69854.1 hypothetical protein Prubr_68750 [Polymorphospora rubra]
MTDTMEMSYDPVDLLVERMRPRLGRPVDAMQVAVALEADGITDRSAQTDYGRPDVFVLADDVWRRLGPVPAQRSAQTARHGEGRALRDISHGLLYLSPSALFPVALALVGGRTMVVALLAVGGLGWVWASCSAWLAYRLLGRGLDRNAGRLLRGAALVGPPVAAGTGLVASPAGGWPLVLLAVGILSYQMAATVALFHRREGALLAVMAPGVLAGLGYVADVVPTGPAVTVGGTSVVTALVFAVHWTTRPAPGRPAATKRPEPSLARAVRPELTRLPVVLIYAGLSAAFLLHANAPYLSGAADLAVAAAPLIAGMGLVEWRAHSFGVHARGLLHRTGYPRQFGAAIWRRLIAEVVIVTGLLSGLAMVLLALLSAAGQLTDAGAVLATAHVAVGAAYFLVFVVANHARYARVCTALAVALAAHFTARQIGTGTADPLQDAVLFLGSAVLLQVSLIAALGGILAQAWRYR